MDAKIITQNSLDYLAKQSVACVSVTGTQRILLYLRYIK